MKTLLSVLLLGQLSIAQAQNSKLTDHFISECLHNCSIKCRIISSDFTKKTFKVKLGVKLNCSVNNESKIDYKYYNDTLNILIQGFHDHTYSNGKDENGKEIIYTWRESAMCDCFFNVDLEFKNFKNPPTTYLINGSTLEENDKAHGPILSPGFVLEQELGSSKGSFKNEIRSDEVYDFIQIAVEKTKLDKNLSLAYSPSTYNKDSIFLVRFLIDTIKVKEPPATVIYDSITNKVTLPPMKGGDYYFPERPKILSMEDIQWMLHQKTEIINFRWESKKSGFNRAETHDWYEISIPMFSKDKTKVIVSISELCPGLCGTGKTYLFVKNKLDWEVKTIASWVH